MILVVVVVVMAVVVMLLLLGLPRLAAVALAIGVVAAPQPVAA